MFVRTVYTVACSVAHPRSWDALSGAVALELIFATGPHSAGRRLVRAIRAVWMSIAAVEKADTLAILTLELVSSTLVLYKTRGIEDTVLT